MRVSGDDDAVRGPDRIGKYLVERALGAGSFATVWLAFDELLETRVAIKVLADNWARSADIRQRFIGEARILRRIDHDRIVRVHDVDELPDGRPYFVMAWADGGSLYDRTAALREANQLMSVTEALSLTIEVCDALSVVHDYGVVHRDVKPSNVLFRAVRNHERTAAAREGRLIGEQAVMLGDFGLAKDVAAASGFTLAAGTPAYMAPEQARASDNIDRRVDVFAITAVLFELLTGAPAFASGTLSGVRRREGGDTTIPLLAGQRDGLDPALQPIIDAGMATDPERRTGSATKLADQLRPVLARLLEPQFTQPGTVLSSGPAQLAPPPSASRPSLQPVGAAGRVKDLMMTARNANLGADGVALLETADEHLSRPLIVTAVTNGFPESFSAAWALLGMRPAAATVAALAGFSVSVRRGIETVGMASAGGPAMAINVALDDNGDVLVSGVPARSPRTGSRCTAELTIDAPGRRDIELEIVPDLDTGADEVDDCDLLVMFADDDADATRPLATRLVELLRPAATGPIAIETLVVAGSGGSEAATAVSATLGAGSTVLADAEVMSSAALSRLRALLEELAEQRGSVVRAAAGLTLLSNAAQFAPPGPARTKLFEEIEATRIELPMLSELDVLRDLAAGRLTLPKPVRRVVRPLFLHAGVTPRLGIDRNSDERHVQQAVERLSGELRVLENTGRVPFTARKAVLLAQQSLDRVHAELAPYL
jgi:serine/threonine protein kinase